MKSQVNRSRCGSKSQGGRRFSPTSRTPPSCNAGRSSASTRTWWRPGFCRVRPRPLATRRSATGPVKASRSSPPTSPWRAGDAVVRGGGPSGSCVESTLTGDGRPPPRRRSCEARARSTATGRHSRGGDVLPEAPGERASHVLAHLVAARPRPQGPIAATASVPTAATPASITAASMPRHPACSGAEPAAVGGCDRDRQAIGGEQRQRPAAVSGEPGPIELRERLGPGLREACRGGSVGSPRRMSVPRGSQARGGITPSPPAAVGARRRSRPRSPRRLPSARPG